MRRSHSTSIVNCGSATVSEFWTILTIVFDKKNINWNHWRSTNIENKINFCYQCCICWLLGIVISATTIQRKIDCWIDCKCDPINRLGIWEIYYVLLIIFDAEISTFEHQTHKMWFYRHWFMHAITTQHKTLPLSLREHSLFWTTTAPCILIVTAVTKMGTTLSVIMVAWTLRSKFKFPILNRLISWKFNTINQCQFSVPSPSTNC